MSKYKDAYFKFEIKPEDSEFLKQWKELSEDEDFQNKLKEIKGNTGTLNLIEREQT